MRMMIVVAALMAAFAFPARAEILELPAVEIDPAAMPGHVFATPIAVDVAFPEDGSLAYEGTHFVWTVTFRAPGATSLSFRARPWSLPEGVSLTLRGAESQAQHDRTDGYQGQLYSAILRGSELTVELRGPQELMDEVAFAIDEVQRGFRYATMSGVAKAEDGNQCQLNYACEAGALHDKLRRSVVTLVISNRGICTGTLLNNARQDRRPIVLSANHCRDEADPFGSGVWTVSGR